MYTTLIDVNGLNANLENESWVIVDCSYDLKEKEKGRDRYLTTHIPGAVFAHVYRDLSGPPMTDKGRHPLPSPMMLIDLFSRLGISDKTQVIAYDDSAGVYASRLWWELNYMGHSAVAVLDGGFEAWTAAGLPTRGGDEKNRRARFEGEPQTDRLVQMEAVLDQALLIDSRDAERFAGLAKGSDPIAGHIEGAKNFHYVLNRDEEKKMKPADALQAAFADLLGTTPPEEATFYCGSGISACYNLLAMVHAGLPMGKLYVGSWSEWSRHTGSLSS